MEITRLHTSQPETTKYHSGHTSTHPLLTTTDVFLLLLKGFKIALIYQILFHIPSVTTTLRAFHLRHAELVSDASDLFNK